MTAVTWRMKKGEGVGIMESKLTSSKFSSPEKVTGIWEEWREFRQSL